MRSHDSNPRTFDPTRAALEYLAVPVSLVGWADFLPACSRTPKLVDGQGQGDGAGLATGSSGYIESVGPFGRAGIRRAGVV